MKNCDDLLVRLYELRNSDKGITIVTNEKEKLFISYGQLWLRSGYVATQLKKMGAGKGSEVFIRCESLEYFLYAFWGCAQNESIAIPIESNNRQYGNEMMRFIQKKVDQTPYLLYDHDGCDLDETVPALDLRKEKSNIYNCEEVREVSVTSEMDDIVYIIYSSGTTGEPNGVVIRKYNIAANVKGYAKHYEITEDDRFLSWSPLTHCYGLITFHMVPLLQGANHCLMSSKLYIQSPLIWMDMVNEYRATRIGSLPFALRHFINIYNQNNSTYNWDLSCVKSMVVGGEQVNTPLLKDFAAISEQYGLSYDTIYPLYGLSEATIMCTAVPQGTTAKAYILEIDSLIIGSKVLCRVANDEEGDDAFLETGIALSTIEICIRDDNDKELEQGCLGYVCIGGPCVTTGYYKNKETTDRVIRDGKWLYTGDVGFLYHDSLIIVGREKELVVANAKKFACSTVENIINSIDEDRPYGVGIICNGNRNKNESEKVILFYQTSIDISDRKSLEAFVRYGEKVKGTVFEKIGLTINEILPIEEFPRTFSGKIFRRELSQNYNNGAYADLLNRMNGKGEEKDKMDTLQNREIEYTQDTVSNKVSEIINQLFKIKIENFETPFTECGVISINIPPFIEKINQEFQIDIPVSAVFSYTNIATLSAYIYQCMYHETEEVKSETKETQVDDDKIAIVGMSCRFPAGSNNIDKFWKTLMTGKDGIVDIPEGRWDVDKYYSDDDDAIGKMYCKKGGFIDGDVNAFDAGLFNISPQEVKYLDPQQRLLLELVWEAFENAGMDITKYYGSETGVYLGISSNEYSLSGIYSGDLSTIGPYSLTGGSFSTICGRVSYLFGFEGPCFSIDTACSSGLTALHLACSAVKSGEAEMAVVAGVNLMLSPVVSVAFSKLRATSKDGVCKSFDESANGYGRAEGGGVLLVKKLSDAIRDKDEILGVVCGSGINQDGRSNGLTAPNGAAQAKLMKKTLQNAHLKADDVDYVEMHGTGTPLGDPIEVNAVADIYGANRSNNLRIGSVKSNIGHLEPASGIASVIKVLLSMRNDMIPANLHFENANSFIQWDKMPIEVVGEHSKWERTDKIRRAGINGFGFGGSNAHVIIEEYRAEEEEKPEETTEFTGGIDYILKISAKNEKSLRDYMFSYIKSLEECKDEDFVNFLYTANRGRVNLNCRVAVTAKDRNEMVDKLKTLMIGGTLAGVYYNYNKHTAFEKNRKVVMMFTGQGSQYLNMGRKLFETNHVFRETMMYCDKMFRAFLLQSILKLLYEQDDEELIAKTVYAQPLIFSINYALYKVWEDIGVKPELVTGHSIGEFVAAVVTGIVSLDDAIKMVAIRGRLMDSAPGKGAMGSIFADKNTIDELIKGYEDSVSIATHNGKDNYVIAGKSDAVKEVLEEAEGRGIRVKSLKVSHAFHSILMEPILNDFKEFIGDVTFHKANGRYLSCLYARELTGNDLLDADYWTTHVRESVEFYGAIESIEHKEEYAFLEVGSARVLSALCKMNLSENSVIAASLKRGEDDSTELAGAIAQLYVSGVEIDWDAVKFDGQQTWKHLFLPNYPYDKESYSMKLLYDRISGSEAVAKSHPLLGERIETPLMEDVVIFQRKFKSNEPFFMSEHIIFEVPISPAAAHMSFILSAVKEVKNPVSCTIKSVEFRIPLAVTSEEERIVQVCLKDLDQETLEFQIVSRDAEGEGQWQVHATGKVAVSYQKVETEENYTFDEMNTWEPDALVPEEGTYRLMRETGFLLGDGFRRIMQVSHVPGSMEEYVSYIEPLETIPGKENYVIYPGTIDSIFQTGTYKEVAKRLQNAELVIDPEKDENMIPYFMEEFTYNYIESGKMTAYTSIIGTDNNFITFNVDVFNEKHELIIKLRKMMAKVTNRKDLLQGIQNIHMPYYYHSTWEEKQNLNELEQDKEAEKYVFVADSLEEAKPFVEAFKEFAIETHVVINGDASTEENVTAIDQENEQAWKTLVNQMATQPNGEKVVFLYLNGCANGEKEQTEMTFTVSQAPLRRLLFLVKALMQNESGKKPGLKIITKNAEAVGKEKAVNLEQAGIWGLSRVLGIEIPSIYQGILDVGNESLTETGFVSEVMGKTEDEVSFFNGKRYVQRVTKTSLSKKSDQDSIVIKEDGAYLITGATGTVGMVYADALVEQGAKKLLLCCRKQPKEVVMEKIEAYRSQGVTVELVFADVCQIETLKKAIQELPEQILPIRGIVHAAGVLEDRMLSEQDWESFDKVLAPKVTGLLNTVSCVETDKLDFVIMTSSITSLIGNLGQSNYAAANYFMNQYAVYLRSFGVPAYAMCWGPWATGGMANSSQDIGRNMEAMGLSALSNELGQSLITQFMEKPENKLMLADIDWKKMSNNLKSNRQAALLDKLLQKYIQQTDNQEETEKLFETISQLDSQEERSSYVRDVLQKICGTIMGFTNPSQLDVNSSLNEQGADSLLMFTMRSAINKTFRTEIEVSTFYNYPTLVQLADYLVNELLFAGTEQTQEEEPEQGIDDVLDEIGKLLD